MDCVVFRHSLSPPPSPATILGDFPHLLRMESGYGDHKSLTLVFRENSVG